MHIHAHASTAKLADTPSVSPAVFACYLCDMCRCSWQDPQRRVHFRGDCGGGVGLLIGSTGRYASPPLPQHTRTHTNMYTCRVDSFWLFNHIPMMANLPMYRNGAMGYTHLGLLLCMRVCMCVCMCVWVCECMYVCAFVRMCAHARVCKCVWCCACVFWWGGRKVEAELVADAGSHCHGHVV